MTVDMQLTYLDFVAERHRIWEQRQAGSPQPWTDDPILASRKFTNVFRVLDHGSQFLLSMLQELDDPKEILARAFLYRHTGRPEPWEFFELMHGRYPLLADLELALETWKSYRGIVRIGQTGKSNRASGEQRIGPVYKRSLFTNAYLVFPQSATPGTDKIESIIDLTRRLFITGNVAEMFLSTPSQVNRFSALRSNKGVADFMSMQILTDFGYTTKYCENSFIVAGPGAVKGAKLLFPTRKAEDVIRWAWEQDLGPRFGERVPSLMDVQNTLCEFSKYARYMEKPNTAPYRPAHPGPQPAPILPKEWS